VNLNARTCFKYCRPIFCMSCSCAVIFSFCTYFLFKNNIQVQIVIGDWDKPETRSSRSITRFNAIPVPHHWHGEVFMNVSYVNKGTPCLTRAHAHCPLFSSNGRKGSAVLKREGEKGLHREHSDMNLLLSRDRRKPVIIESAMRLESASICQWCL
jgi:hypothetical protein